ncbi:MAG: RNA-directed DNA polymerase [Myxococcales bacterium]|nr:RNA-directed DNA polymerase [Myxococcales bacterium]
MATRPNDRQALWAAIARAGGIDAYVQAQLVAGGFAAERKPTDGMSKRELARYKAELKAEAAEKKRLKAEAWAAYKATHIVHLGEGVYFNDADDFDRFDLAEPEARLAENGLPRIDDPQALAEALALSVPTLRWLTFHRDAATMLHYRRFTIPKKSGGERAIWAPMDTLKSAQRWVLRHIVEPLPVHGAAHGFVPGRGIVSNAQAHSEARILINVDLKDFFPTVTVRRVKGVFRKAGYREQVATLLAMLCTEAPREVVRHGETDYFIALGPRCLPQGAPTSPALTNTLCLRLDRRLSGLARQRGWRYTRYADDLTFSLPVKAAKGADGNVGTLLGAVRAIVEAEGFALNPKKTRICRPGGRQKVTGLIVNGAEPPRAPRALRRMLRAAVHNLEQGKPLPEGETVARLAGYAAFIYQTNPQEGAELLRRFAAFAGEQA